MSCLTTVPEYIERMQGTNLSIEVPVTAADGITPANLVGAKAKFSYRKVGASAWTAKDCTFVSNVIHADLLPSDTLTMLGQYEYELRLKTATGELDGQVKGKFSILYSFNPWIT